MVNQTLRSSPLSSFFNTPTAENVVKGDFDSKDNSKIETENGGLQKKDTKDVKEKGSNKIPLFLFSQKDDLKKNEAVKNPLNLIFVKSSPEKGLVEKFDEKKQAKYLDYYADNFGLITMFRNLCFKLINFY